MSTEHLTHWIIASLFVGAIASTAIPIFYSFFPWTSRPIGRLFMFQAVALALALDTRVLLWVLPRENRVLALWINAIMLALIALATVAMAWWMLSKVLLMKKEEKNAARQPHV
jgi:hypothetical protein